MVAVRIGGLPGTVFQCRTTSRNSGVGQRLSFAAWTTATSYG